MQWLTVSTAIAVLQVIVAAVAMAGATGLIHLDPHTLEWLITLQAGSGGVHKGMNGKAHEPLIEPPHDQPKEPE